MPTPGLCRPRAERACSVVVGLKMSALLVERFDVRLQRGQSELVERQDVLSVFGLAIRLDDPAVYDDAGYLDRERPGVQVEQVTAGACRSQRRMPEVASRGRLPRRSPGVSSALCLPRRARRTRATPGSTADQRRSYDMQHQIRMEPSSSPACPARAVNGQLRSPVAATTSSAALRAIADAIALRHAGQLTSPPRPSRLVPGRAGAGQTSVPSPPDLHTASTQRPHSISTVSTQNLHSLHGARTPSMCVTGTRLQGSRRLRERQQARIPRRLQMSTHEWDTRNGRSGDRS